MAGIRLAATDDKLSVQCQNLGQLIAVFVK